MAKTKRLVVRMDEAAYKIVAQKAKLEYRNVSQPVRHLLKIWLLGEQGMTEENISKLFPLRTRRKF